MNFLTILGYGNDFEKSFDEVQNCRALPFDGFLKGEMTCAAEIGQLMFISLLVTGSSRTMFRFENNIKGE
ncbi:hypothetical protein BELL_1025g00010 [Botrytis elliptica]|uniref:Uncharacterized protein n=1 Tax=Botrytis elliptica TaxID=278938 RepID=A0A4Z1IZU3_9HELO|nr:hypothetical protein BELL_1025g00010 [Botrytis elliptica]